MDKYSDYSAIDFLNDDSFVSWIMKTDINAVKYWDEFIKNNPSKQEEIDGALEIFSHFRVKHEKIPVEELFSMWHNITNHSARKTRITALKMLKYAAIFVVVFLTGALSFYIFQEFNTREFTIAENAQIDSEEAQIILSNGQSVPLHQKETEIKYNPTGERIVVNNDTITQKRTDADDDMNRVIMPFGKNSQITLSDGTKVWLNAGSQLLFPSTFTRKTREVLLIGEAFFEVIHNKEKPFIVRTEYVDVEVLGTSFDVSAYTDDKYFETVLVEGKVGIEEKKERFLSGREKIILQPNQRIVINKVEGDRKVSEVDVSVYTSWKDGMLKFESENLDIILRKLERYYNKKIIIKDALLGGYKISGKLDLKNSIEEVLDIIQLTVPIDWGKQKEGDYFIIKTEMPM